MLTFKKKIKFQDFLKTFFFILFIIYYIYIKYIYLYIYFFFFIENKIKSTYFKYKFFIDAFKTKLYNFIIYTYNRYNVRYGLT